MKQTRREKKGQKQNNVSNVSKDALFKSVV